MTNTPIMPIAAEPADDSELGGATAVLYVRVSTKEQAERDGDPEGYSIPAQREACKRKAESLGAVVLDEFVDRGESARTADRPELQRMLEFLHDNQVTYVIVHKIDRLARNRADDVAINLAIKQAGVQLVSVTENIDETPSGILLHGIMSSIAEFYSRNLANEVIKGSVQKAKSGGTPMRTPTGYLNVRRMVNGQEVRTVEIDPVRGPLMKWAFEAYADGGWTIRTLLEELTRRGLASVPGPRTPAKPLGTSNLQRLLRHPYYMGIVRYRGVLYPGKHEPLVESRNVAEGPRTAGRPQLRRREATRTPPLPQGLGLLRNLREPARGQSCQEPSWHRLRVLRLRWPSPKAHHLHPTGHPDRPDRRRRGGRVCRYPPHRRPSRAGARFVLDEIVKLRSKADADANARAGDSGRCTTNRRNCSTPTTPTPSRSACSRPNKPGSPLKSWLLSPDSLLSTTTSKWPRPTFEGARSRPRVRSCLPRCPRPASPPVQSSLLQAIAH